MSDDEKDEDVELQAADIITPDKATRRRRPPNQTEEAKKAWDEESKLIKNAKARQTRVRKKAEKEAQIALSNSSNSLGSVTFLPSVPPSVPPPPPQPPPISLDPEISQATGRILRLRDPMAIRDRI
jgi:hypothetical protein